MRLSILAANRTINRALGRQFRPIAGLDGSHAGASHRRASGPAEVAYLVGRESLVRAMHRSA